MGWVEATLETVCDLFEEFVECLGLIVRTPDREPASRAVERMVGLVGGGFVNVEGGLLSGTQRMVLQVGGTREEEYAEVFEEDFEEDFGLSLVRLFGLLATGESATVCLAPGGWLEARRSGVRSRWEHVGAGVEERYFETCG